MDEKTCTTSKTLHIYICIHWSSTLLFTRRCGKILCLCCACWILCAGTLKTLKHTTVLHHSDLRLPKSPTMAVAVLWCAETSSSSFQEISVASPLVCPFTTPSALHTSLHRVSPASVVVRALRPKLEKKRAVVVSLQERWASFFLSFFFSASLVSH